MNKTERLLYQKHTLSDEERNQILKLMNCGLAMQEIADIMHVSKSTVSYIRQAHTACLDKDWDTLQRLSTSGSRPAVEWAMRITGADKIFNETFKKPEETLEVAEEGNIVQCSEDFNEVKGLLSGIYNLLSEIRDMLK